ncbi:PPR domain-containing protein/PPR_1 domain-containing protein/PPR_2 domain-containing protein/PPR_3 domain-containing protein, partial [Cephalotus follicularis]
PSTGFSEDGVPSWEKKFCALIGSTPWRKVVDAKNYMYCYGNVVNWDDSAGEEAFQNAKKRFWAKINGRLFDISLPDPDLYIDEINWNPDIDDKLIKDIEQAYFAPDEGDNEVKAWCNYKKTRNLVPVPSDLYNKNPGNDDNPWEYNSNTEGTEPWKITSQGWNQWDNSANDSINLNKSDNPWEHSITLGNEAVKKSTLGDCGNHSGGWNQGGSNTDRLRNWDNGDDHWQHNYQGARFGKKKGLDGFGDNACSWNQQNFRKFDNGDSSRGHSFVRDRGYPKDGGWRDSGGNTWGWKQWENYNNDGSRSLELGKNNGGWGTWNKGMQKREGSRQYVTGDKNSRFRGDDYQINHCLNGVNAKKSSSNKSKMAARNKPYFFYGHRKPSQNRPTVHGGLFSNRQTLSRKPHRTTLQSQPFILHKWDPHFLPSQTPSSSRPSIQRLSPRLSPIARFILDSFRKNRDKWGPLVVSELRKLRRITPNLVTEVLKVENSPALAAKFFHWAGKQKGYKHNFASYNAFAYCLNRNNMFRAADQVIELMDSQGKPPTEKQFEILIRMHSDSKRGLRVYYVYQKMKKFGVKPRVFLYNRIMDALIKNGYLDLALAVYQDFKGDGLVEESVTYMILIKGLCKAGRVEDMLEVLVSEGNLDGCLKVWDELKADGVDPDVMAYATLVTGLCKGGRVDKGYELFREMEEKGVLIDRAIYGVLVEAFVKDGKVASACDLLKDMVCSGYRADLEIHNSIIEGLCRVKRVDKAYKLFQVTVEEGLEPDFATVNPMLACYAEMKKMDDFFKLLSQMEKLGFSVIEDLLKFFASLVEKENRIMTALEVFEDLKVKGYASVLICNTLMGALLNTGNVKKVLSLYGEMKDLNLEPDSMTRSIAIICFVETGDIQEACMCHNKIIEMSDVPSIAAYRSLVKGLCKIGDIDAAMMLARDCLASVRSGPMEFKYTLTIIHVCRSCNAEKVIEVLDEMMQEGCPLDDVIYFAIIYGMCKHGTLEEARKAISKLRERKILTEANTIVYDEMLIEHMKKKTADLVLSGLKFFGLESKLKAKGSTLLSS